MVLRIDGQKPDNISMLGEDSANSIYPQESVSIVAVTWNLFASVPPINSLVQLSRSSSFSPAPDLIFVGTQECERSLLVSFCCEAKREWEAMLTEVFGEYTLAATQVMRGLHTAVLIRNKLRNYFSVEREGRVKAGTCGVMGNKGAISLEVAVLGQTFQLVNCHLAPHQSGTAVRNDTIARILGELVSKDLQCEVIFLGDFNYRIEMSKQEYQMLNVDKQRNTDEEVNYFSFLKRQQLTNQQALQQNFLKRFQQGTIDFPPTYKMDIRTNEYSRTRVPGWTDRIFTRKRVDEKSMRRDSYICEYSITGCDHRPVVGRYHKHVPQGIVNFGNDYQGKRRREESQACALI